MPAHLLDPETVCEDSGFDWPSTGAFVIETVDSSRAALVRNEAYWKRDSVTAAQPYLDALEDSSLVFGETAPNGTFDARMWAWLIGPLLDSVIFRVKPDEGESLEDLLAGALDGLDGKVGNPLSADRLAGLPDGVLVGEAQSGRIVQQLSMQFGDDDDLLQSVLFRQALVYALDTAVLAEAEGRPVATGLLEPGGVGPWVQYAQDAATARALVRRACTSAGRDCDNDPPRVDLFYRARNEAAAALIEEMWSDIGVEVRLRLSVPHDGAYAPGGVAIWSYIAGSQGLVGALGMNVVDCYLGSNPNYGRPGGCEPGTLISAAERLDLLLAEYASTANVDRGREILIQVEQLMADNVMLIPYSWRVASPGAYWEDRVAGIVPNIHGVNTWNIATWYRPDQAEGDES